eukprot:4449318-Prymnesium_polylepis.2
MTCAGGAQLLRKVVRAACSGSSPTRRKWNWHTRRVAPPPPPPSCASAAAATGHTAQGERSDITWTPPRCESARVSATWLERECASWRWSRGRMVLPSATRAWPSEASEAGGAASSADGSSAISATARHGAHTTRGQAHMRTVRHGRGQAHPCAQAHLWRPPQRPPQQARLRSVGVPRALLVRSSCCALDDGCGARTERRGRWGEACGIGTHTAARVRSPRGSARRPPATGGAGPHPAPPATEGRDPHARAHPLRGGCWE